MNSVALNSTLILSFMSSFATYHTILFRSIDTHLVLLCSCFCSFNLIIITSFLWIIKLKIQNKCPTHNHSINQVILDGPPWIRSDWWAWFWIRSCWWGYGLELHQTGELESHNIGGHDQLIMALIRSNCWVAPWIRSNGGKRPRFGISKQIGG